MITSPDTESHPITSAGRLREAYDPVDIKHDAADNPDAFKALIRLAGHLFDVPVVLISVIDETNDRQIFIGEYGLAEPWATRQETPLSHSFCQHVKNLDKPLIVSDASAHDLVADNLAIRDLNVVAYMGVPFHGPDGAALGAICLIDAMPRDWSDSELSALSDLALCVTDVIALRSIVRRASQMNLELQQSYEKTRRYSALRETIASAFMAPGLTPPARFTALLRSGCEALGLEAGRIARVDGDTSSVLFSHAPHSQNNSPAKTETSGCLAAHVLAGEAQVHFTNGAHCLSLQKHDLGGNVPATYCGMPLVIGGVLFGILEFSDPTPRQAPFTDEELSIFCVLAMFASGHLSIFDQVCGLQASMPVQFEEISKFQMTSHI